MTAISQDAVSRIVGYKILKGDFSTTNPNLPQRIAIIGEANDANQTGLDLDGTELTTAKQAALLYGYGSPIYQVMRILKPLSGSGVGSIPIKAYPQEAAVGATAKVLEITPTGSATGNATHTLVVNGRSGFDGQNYSFVVASGDSEAVIAGKMSDALNAVLGSPVIGTVDAGPDRTVATSKWLGLTADDITISVDTNGDAAGVTYAVVSTASGAGTPAVAGSLAKFENEWNTIVINSYGTVSATMDELEEYNGVADPNNPTGRYEPTVFKPFVALTGTTDSVLANLKAIGNARKDEMTIALCVAPDSLSLPLEVAANMAEQYAVVAQDAPQLDVQDKFYRDIHVPTSSIGDMENYTERDLLVKAGVSTVSKVNGKYRIYDFVTTYHPDLELPPQFRYPRDLNIDWNIRFGEEILVETYVLGKAIAGETDIVTAVEIVKPSMYKQNLLSYATSLSQRALIADAAFMQSSIIVEIDGVNPNRINSSYSYKRTGFGRIASTTATAGFNFGNS